MVEAKGGDSDTKQIDTDQPHGILKHGHVDHDAHVHFDEHEIAEYDKTRGQTMKIDDPKTPFYEDSNSDNDKDEEDEQEMDPTIKAHLDEAQQNRLANSKVTSGVKRKSNPGQISAAQ